RARLLDGALPRRRRRGRPGRRARRRDLRGRDARRAAVRALGRRRPVARHHDPRPRRARQRPQRAAHRRPARRLPRARRRPGVAELRGVPLRARTGREDRRGPRRAALGAGAAHGVAVVADRDALPLQRPLRPGVGAALPGVRRRARPAPHRRRGVRGRGLRRPPAGPAPAAAPV
ncbi:MAG: L-O-lysylphosphatidylglycerol synthase, partial [uncultured Actinomycetospora sp.]